MLLPFLPPSVRRPPRCFKRSRVRGARQGGDIQQATRQLLTAVIHKNWNVTALVPAAVRVNLLTLVERGCSVASRGVRPFCQRKVVLLAADATWAYISRGNQLHAAGILVGARGIALGERHAGTGGVDGPADLGPRSRQLAASSAFAHGGYNVGRCRRSAKNIDCSVWIGGLSLRHHVP
jgi:hypothetical protein